MKLHKRFGRRKHVTSYLRSCGPAKTADARSQTHYTTIIRIKVSEIIFDGLAAIQKPADDSKGIYMSCGLGRNYNVQLNHRSHPALSILHSHSKLWSTAKEYGILATTYWSQRRERSLTQLLRCGSSHGLIRFRTWLFPLLHTRELILFVCVSCPPLHAKFLLPRMCRSLRDPTLWPD